MIYITDKQLETLLNTLGKMPAELSHNLINEVERWIETQQISMIDNRVLEDVKNKVNTLINKEP